jgi:Mce-associated membrane protein
VAAVVLGVVSVGLAVGLVLTLVALGNDHDAATARSSALASARTAAVEIGGYDYRHLGQDFGRVLASSTPSFRRSFSQSSDALRSTLRGYDATSAAKVVSAGLVSSTPTRAVVLVLLDQTISNSAQSKPTTERSQIEITLVRSKGRWLIDQVTLL